MSKWIQKTLDEFEGFSEIVRIELENQRRVRKLYVQDNRGNE